jgi:hypothetical protein
MPEVPSCDPALPLDAAGFMCRLVGEIRQDTAERISDLNEIRYRVRAFRLGGHGSRSEAQPSRERLHPRLEGQLPRDAQRDDTKQSAKDASAQRER